MRSKWSLIAAKALRTAKCSMLGITTAVTSQRLTASHRADVSPAGERGGRVTRVAGATCPPEDVGGPWRYAEFLQAYDDPANDEHQQFRDWAGDGFDATSFDA
jgi:hypothetical protein